MPGDSLKTYRAKRNFEVTSEPAEGGESNEDQPVFVIQKHWASRLHYDLRLELDGTMKSWAVPKGPSYDPHDKRMAVQVEDHPIAYNQFEGEIPKGEYGAGKVIIWDEGTWTPLEDPRKGYRDGMLKFEMHGRKMLGKWALIRIKSRGSEKQPPWLLIKEKDAYTKPASEFSVVDELPDSVVPLRDAAKKSGAKAAAKKAAPKKAAKATEPTKSAKPAPSAKTAKSKSEAAGAAEASTGNTTRQRASTAGLPGQAAELPAALKPQLATLVEGVPGNPKDWLFEIKYDGYRLLARIEGKEVKLFTRNGHDWTHKLTHLAKVLQKLKLKSGWLDGEIVVVDDKGVPNFQLLQNAFDSSRTGSIVFYLFDAPFLNGRDLRQEPLETRRESLRGLFEAGAPDELRFSETFDARPQDLVASACRMGLEGVIGKLKSSPYVTRRADSWVKLKCSQRQEFVIGGYTDPKGGRVHAV
ncbi:3'-phosphoesterase / DNA ligase D / DNA repair polymerase (fragment) [Burkholderiales bacterium 8X]